MSLVPAPDTVWNLLGEFGKLISKWQVDIRPVFEIYVYAGCKCDFTPDIIRKQDELREIQSTYSQLYQYLQDAEVEADRAYDALQVENRTLTALLRGHAQQKRKYEVTIPPQKRGCRCHGVASLGAEIARWGALSRLEKERKQTRAIIVETAQKIKSQEIVVAKAGNRYLNAKTLADWIRTELKLADINMTSVNNMSTQEETWGSGMWNELRDMEISKVASKGLKGLICQCCNGYRWEAAKEPLMK